MRKVRLIYLALLVGSIVLVSFKGGKIPWLLFYFMLTIPVLSVLYILYIYARFHIGQQLTRYVKKGERIPYKLELANDDLLLMTGISLNFYTDTIQVMKKSSEGTMIPYEQEPDSFSLLPHQHKEAELELYCKYRGTYPVGVKSVSVRDFFGLFTVTYPHTAHIKLTARPRILSLAQLKSILEKRDPKKNRPAVSRFQDILDFDLRKYIPGDSLRRVHWKNSAKAGELLIRKQAPQELYEFVIVMDCARPENKTELELMQREDNIIETAVALVYDACAKKIRTHVFWYTDKVCEMRIDNPKAFDKFYNLCAEMPFHSSKSLEEAWEACERKASGAQTFILIGSDVSDSLSKKVDKNRRTGKDVLLIDTGEAPL